MAIVTDYTSIYTPNHWTQRGVDAQPGFVTYSFDTSTTDYAYLLKYNNFTQAFIDSIVSMNDTLIGHARTAISQWDSVSGLRFLEVPAGQGELRIASADFSSVAAYSQFGGIGFFPFIDITTTYAFMNTELSGDIFINLNKNLGDTAQQIGLFLHEVGHAIGLDHPHDEQGSNLADPSVDSQSNTIMSYNGDYRGGLGPFDVQAIQRAHGEVDGAHLLSWGWDQATLTLTQIDGTDSETIIGVSVKDVVDAGAGDDRIATFSGDDLILPGDGDDLVFGGEGVDTVRLAGSANAYSVQAQNGGYVITNSTDTNTIFEVERLEFDDAFMSLINISAQLSTSQLQELAKLYLAYFNRAPESSGFEYHAIEVIAAMGRGTSFDQALSERADQFFSAAIAAPEFSGYSASQPTTQFVETIYSNVLLRPGAGGNAATEQDVSYWTNRVASGEISRGDLVIEFLNAVDQLKTNGTPEEQAIANQVDAVIQNRITVAMEFAKQEHSLGLSGQAAFDAGVEILEGVDETQASVDAALAKLSSGGSISSAASVAFSDTYVVLPESSDDIEVVGAHLPAPDSIDLLI